MGKRGDSLRARLGAFSQDSESVNLAPVKSPVYRPSDSDIAQYTFWGNRVTTSELGLFFELAGTAIYGGSLVDTCYGRLPGDSPLRRFKGVDIVDLENKFACECKGRECGQTLILRDGQMLNYFLRQLENPDFDFSISINTHDFKGIGSFQGDRSELYGSLAQKTLYCTRIGFGVLDDLVIAASSSNYVSRVSNERYPSAVRLSRRLLGELFFDPHQTLREIGLDPEHYKIDYGVVPQGINVSSLSKGELDGLNGEARRNVFELSPFPVATLSFQEGSQRERYLNMIEDRKKELKKFLSPEEVNSCSLFDESCDSTCEASSVALEEVPF